MPPSSEQDPLARFIHPKHVVELATLKPDRDPEGIWVLTLHMSDRPGFRTVDLGMDLDKRILATGNASVRQRILQSLAHAHSRLTDEDFGWRSIPTDPLALVHGVVSTRERLLGLPRMGALLRHANGMPNWYSGELHLAIATFLLRLDLSRSKLEAVDT